jgi:hypothetical protein
MSLRDRAPSAEQIDAALVDGEPPSRGSMPGVGPVSLTSTAMFDGVKER